MLARALLILSLLTGESSLAQAPTSLRLLALGDSFTIGTSQPESLNFPSQLAGMLRKRGVEVRLENVAVNGYSTKELIREELPALEVVKPNVVTLAVGANDIVRESNQDAYRGRLKHIFQTIRAARVAPSRIFVLPQPDWSRSPVAAAFGDRDQLRARIETYNAILADEARAAGATYVDLWPLMMEQAAAKMVAEDGLHPRAKAYTAWAERLAPLIAPR